MRHRCAVLATAIAGVLLIVVLWPVVQIIKGLCWAYYFTFDRRREGA